jgi:hypothetical protein
MPLTERFPLLFKRTNGLSTQLGDGETGRIWPRAGTLDEREEAPQGTAAIKVLREKNRDEVGGLIDAFGQNYQITNC